MAYKIIYETFWTDPEIKKLSLETRLLYLYLITNPHAYYSGIYYLPESLIKEETGMSTQTIQKGIANLEGRVKYDRPNSVVWVVNMAKYQINQGNNANMIKGIPKHLKTLPKCQLIGQYLEYYKDWRIPFTNPCPTPKEPIPESVAVEVAVKEEGEVAGKGESKEEKPSYKGYYHEEIQKELRKPLKDKSRIKELTQKWDEEGEKAIPDSEGTFITG